MTTNTTNDRDATPALRVLVGYDGSPSAADAIAVGAAMFPGAEASIGYLWMPPFASPALSQRLRSRARNLDDLVDLIEHEGGAEAQRIVDAGVALAHSAGWTAEGVVRRTYGGEGFQMAQLAEELGADLVLIGSRGMGGTRAALGSVADVIVHYSTRPVVVVPRLLATAERAALPAGPVVLGWDGSPGAEAALTAAAKLFPGRELIPAEVRHPEESESTGTQDALAPTVVHLPMGRAIGASRAVADQLEACAEQRGAAAIVVGSRGRNALRELLLGSVAMATLHHARRPVVIVPKDR